ncbi:MAG: 50S ribosomal protein L11 methyltransferase [Gammaproteobacteria bacterium]|nr:MAG: 50S ribosomal protein L11 methyltransferase [Gammaproteobacteria bacterium]
MSWIQFIIETQASEIEATENLLEDLGSLAITLEDNADTPLFEPPLGTTPLWQDTRVIGLFDQQCDTQLIQNALRQKFGQQTPIRFEILEDKNWQTEWMKHYQPIQMGQRLWVCPEWQTPPEPDAVNLMLNPGLAFGTGTHPTTALCLKWLDQASLAQKTVVDFGCGSGILGIAAQLLGCAQVYAVDNDPQALISSRENATLNHVEGKIQVFSPEQVQALHDKEHFQADVMVANILANPLISLAPMLASMTKAGGDIILSGILEQQADLVIEAYRAYFDDFEVKAEGEWRLIHARRTQS